MIRSDSTPTKLVHQFETVDASPELHWVPPPETIQLESGQIHLWAAALHEFFDQATKFVALLSSIEQAAAEKFAFPEDRNRYVVRHGLLRQILSRYLGQLPSTIEFQYGAHGKPELRTGGKGLPLFFNTSDSADVFVCAITSVCPIGVDIEHTRQISDFEGIAHRYFSRGETQALMALPSGSRMQAFYGCWTSKEAYLKATGEGIAEHLAKVEVAIAPNDEPGVVSVSGSPLARREWNLQRFSPAPGYVGCVAYRNKPLAISEWRLGKSIP